MKTPKPLTKRQRERADRARAHHLDVVRLDAQADAARGKRDAQVIALLNDRVPPFVCVNETGIPETTMLGLVKKAKAAHPAGGAK